eukprot:TRINITY_DN21201_c0_g1_i1.p1 TRINITY_DN21201_c0_g1~~TRINITY_DN21201_c0_g1_i1.p1  ORF type:complete len:585 (-),score=68.82 TRINITY_DN21201_c0_g1_i1:220-1944(-)
MVKAKHTQAAATPPLQNHNVCGARRSTNGVKAECLLPSYKKKQDAAVETLVLAAVETTSNSSSPLLVLPTTPVDVVYPSTSPVVIVDDSCPSGFAEEKEAEDSPMSQAALLPLSEDEEEAVISAEVIAEPYSTASFPSYHTSLGLCESDNDDVLQMEEKARFINNVANDIHSASCGKYKVNCCDADVCLGSGSFGNVFKAENTNTKELVAVKQIRGHNFKDAELTHRLVRELQVLMSVSHHNLIALKDVLQSYASETVYIITELMDFDLGNVHPESMTQDAIECVLTQILLGTMTLHNAGIIHRDLKPQNVVMNSHWEVKICDFGLAGDSLSTDKTQYVVTRWYRAPEIILGMEYGAPADMWSIGCLLFEIVNGGVALFELDSSQNGGQMKQLQQILSVVGLPDENNMEWWRDLYSLKEAGSPHYKVLEVAVERVKEDHGQLGQGVTASHFQSSRRHLVTKELLGLLNMLLTLDTTKRLTVEECLGTEYIKQSGYLDRLKSAHVAAQQQKNQNTKWSDNIDNFLPDKKASLSEQKEALSNAIVHYQARLGLEEQQRQKKELSSGGEECGGCWFR